MAPSGEEPGEGQGGEMKILRPVRYALYCALALLGCSAVLRKPEPAPSAAEPSVTEAEVYSISTVGFGGEHELVLEATGEAIGGRKYLSIIIGPFEGRAIQMALNGISPRRPQTHDLLERVTSACGARVFKVTVTKLEERTYYAVLTFSRNGRMVDVDARPSDSIALAARVGCPIYVADQVLLEAGSAEPGGREEVPPSLPDELFF